LDCSSSESRASHLISSALLGLGKIGIEYDMNPNGFIPGQTMTHVRALLESEYFELVGISDALAGKSIEIQKFLEINLAVDTKIWNKSSTADLIVIAVPTDQHVAAIDSIQRIPKLLVLEKPGGINSGQCLQIMDWGDRNNVRIFVNYCRRYLPNTIESSLYLEGLDTGALISARINAYGSLLNIFSHFIDLAIFLIQRPLFCACTKEIFWVEPGRVNATCKQCNVIYDLDGVDGKRKAVSMVLDFENIQMSLTSDGQDIEIVSKQDGVSKHFHCDSFQYRNYQKLVYKKIGQMQKDGVVDSRFDGLGQAIQVHRFLESVR
jgi:predicted dehydrogenase